ISTKQRETEAWDTRERCTAANVTDASERPPRSTIEGFDDAPPRATTSPALYGGSWPGQPAPRNPTRIGRCLPSPAQPRSRPALVTNPWDHVQPRRYQERQPLVWRSSSRMLLSHNRLA